MSLDLTRTEGGSLEEVFRMMALAEIYLKNTIEVLSIRSQYFRDIIYQGVEMARSMAFILEKGHDVAFSESYRFVCEYLSKMKVEAANNMAKDCLGKASALRGGRPRD